MILVSEGQSIIVYDGFWEINSLKGCTDSIGFIWWMCEGQLADSCIRWGWIIHPSNYFSIAIKLMTRARNDSEETVGFPAFQSVVPWVRRWRYGPTPAFVGLRGSHEEKSDLKGVNIKVRWKPFHATRPCWTSINASTIGKTENSPSNSLAADLWGFWAKFLLDCSKLSVPLSIERSFQCAKSCTVMGAIFGNENHWALFKVANGNCVTSSTLNFWLGHPCS